MYFWSLFLYTFTKDELLVQRLVWNYDFVGKLCVGPFVKIELLGIELSWFGFGGL